jgi:hypothetical protein
MDDQRRPPGHGPGKAKTPAIVAEIRASKKMTIVLDAEGRIESVKNGNDPAMTQAEFSFEDTFLDNLDYEGGKVVELLDMHAMTVLVLRFKKPDGNSEIKKYVWEGNRYWW